MTAAMIEDPCATTSGDPLAAVWPHLLALRRHVRQGAVAPDAFVLDGGSWHYAGEAEAADRALVDALAQVAGAPGRLAIGQLGQSLDGRIATPTGKSHYINGVDGRRHLHRLRALADAVVVGAGTVTADDPRLTVRLVSGPNPVRVVIDPQMRCSADRAVFAGDGPDTWVLTRAAHLLGERQALPLDLPGTPAGILDLLAVRGCRVVLVEGGTATLSRFLEAGALHRLHLMIAPLLIGSGHPGFELPPIDTLDQAHRPAVHWLPLGPELLADVQFSGDDRGAE